MGKSAAASLLAEQGVPVIDTDGIAREIVEPGQPALQEVVKAFGPDVLDPQGRLRRDELARRVFPDPAARQRLEEILHPRIREAWLAQVGRWIQDNRPIGVIVIPLLFETDAASQFTATVCVACSSATQLARLRARGWTDEQISQRLAAQWPIDKKIAPSDFVIWTEGPLAIHAQQLQRVLSTVLP